MNGIFTISLDFELHWGGFEKWPLQHYREYFFNTRKVIPEMLARFENNQVHVTWATVGILFHQNRQSMLKAIPDVKPTYTVQELSAYHYMDDVRIGEDESEDPFHYAASIVKKILATPGQELGSHTFAHYYCNEPGQNHEQFRADIKAAQYSAKLYDVELTSLVFPRNQFNDHYLKVCADEGLTAVRDNPADWFWNIRSTQRESIWKRLNRGLDAYLPIGKKNIYTFKDITYTPGLPLCLPASRLLRPYNPKMFFLNRMRIMRLKREMERAARTGAIYHLWWHPHNFGNFPEQNLRDLDEILLHFRRCREQYGMQSMTMRETTELFLKTHGKTAAA